MSSNVRPEIGCFLLILILLGIVFEVLKWVGGFLYPILLYVALPIIAFSIVCFLIYIAARSIYHALNPEAKREYLKRKASKVGKELERKEQEEARAKKLREESQAQAARERAKSAERLRENERRQHRDGATQTKPYTYKIGNHGNESLAIRYGIANQEKKIKEYWYFEKGGVRSRNLDRDTIYYEPAKTIRLQKTKRVSNDLYEVLLSDFSDRKARAIIEKGTEHVKTFYPIDESWFEKQVDLEETLKGNGSFSLKELATFHVQKRLGL